MATILRGLSMLMVVCPIVLLSSIEAAPTISAAVARKCREMAVKTHPVHPPGTKAYAGVEREYFRDCVSKETTGNKPKQ